MDSNVKHELSVPPHSRYPVHFSYAMPSPLSPPVFSPKYSPTVSGTSSSSYFPHYATSMLALEPQAEEPPKQKHIPRPANAFMLFRSDFLKKGVIPSHVERRQQNLSRVAGEIWNLMPAEEKEKWKASADEELAKHHRMYPEYKFNPAPRGSGRAKGKSRRGIEEAEIDDKRRIRELRETYARVAGPAAMPARRRRPRESKTKSKGKFADSDALCIPLPASIPTSPELQSNDPPFTAPPLPRFFPSTEPHYATQRRPSTSLGFATRQDMIDSRRPQFLRPASAGAHDASLTTLVRDLDITPVFANFRHISLSPPTTYPSSNDSFSNLDSTLGLSDLRLPYNALTPESAVPRPILDSFQDDSMLTPFFYPNVDPFRFNSAFKNPSSSAELPLNQCSDVYAQWSNYIYPSSQDNWE